MTSLTIVRRIRARPSVVFDALATFTHSRLRNEETRRSHEEGWNGALDKLERHFFGSERTQAALGERR